MTMDDCDDDDKKVTLLRRPLPPSAEYNQTRCTIKTQKKKLENSQQEGNSLYKLPFSDTGCINDIHIYPLHPKGRAPLPMGKFLHAPVINASNSNVINPNEFTFNDFLLPNGLASKRELISSAQIVISRENYVKMTSWFALNPPRNASLNLVNLEMDQLTAESRTPYHLMILEFQSILMELTSAVVDGSTSTLGGDVIQEDLIIQSPRSRYFCGLGRSDTPFDSSSKGDVTGVLGLEEVAILESMLYGGTKLSLKAHFLSALPNLVPLSSTLTHLNISFNNLEIFPLELCQLKELKELTFRNNPIKEIPSDIRSLQKLKVLSAPFNLLTNLPPGLFELSSLEDLDVSHNSIQLIPNDIGQLRSLRKLNVEYNELIGLPPTLIDLPLYQIQTESNYLHPLLWKENTHNQPQVLSDMCCLIVNTHYRIDDIPSSVIKILDKPDGWCNYCNGPIYGSGLRLIRSVTVIERMMRDLPFVFEVCSSQCHRHFRKSPRIKWEHGQVVVM